MLAIIIKEIKMDIEKKAKLFNLSKNKSDFYSCQIYI